MSVDYVRTCYSFDDLDVLDAAQFVDRTGLPALIRQWQAEDGIIDRAARRGPQFTLRAVLTSLRLVITIGATVTIAEILRVIYRLSSTQLEMVGMTIAEDDRDRFRYDEKFCHREDARFRSWLTSQLEVLDAYWDQPVAMMLNREYKKRIAQRNLEQRARAEQRLERGRIAANAVIRASLDWCALAEWRGDLLADETLIDVATVRAGMGSNDLKMRSAVSRADFYLRTQNHELVAREDGFSSARDIVKMGFALGVTAVQAVGPIRSPGSVPRPIVAIDIGGPTAGDGDALIRCLDMLHTWEKTPIPTSRQRNRSLGVDMGYIGKPHLSHYLLEHRIDLIHAYPKRRGKGGSSQSSTYVLPSDWPTDDARQKYRGSKPGPVLAWGEWYCPAAQHLLAQNPTLRRREMASPAALDRHDRMLAERTPYVMGRLDRPRYSDVKRAARRPDETADKRWKGRFQCPAEQQRIRCHLKPASMKLDPILPTARPTWDASAFRCCQSEVTVTMSDRQLSSFQPGLTPGSFEHQTVLETYRARTESRFAHLKHPSVSGLKRMSVGPRRDPLLILQIAMAVAVSNERIQRNFKPDHTDLIAKDLAGIDRTLGRRATRKPYRS